MAASGAKNVGSYGKIRVLVDLVLPQNTGANTSQVRVRGQMALRQGSNANNQNGVHMKTIASPGGSTTESNPFSVGTSWVTVIDNTYTVSHAADGNRTVTGTFELGSTGTTSFGSGGSVSLALKLPRIPRPPSKPGKPTISNVTNSSLRGNLASAPANNGASIIEYGWQFENVDTSGTATDTTSGRTWNLTGRAANTRYRVRVRARNSVGWGPYSDWSGTVTTKVNPPAAPTNVDFVRQSDTRHVVSWSRNVSGNAPYTSQRVQRQTHANEEWGNWENLPTVSATATSYTDTTTQPNRAYRWRVQAINATGSAVSAQSGPSRTTPAPPVDVSARKVSGSDDIRVTFTWRAGYASAVHEVQDNPGGAGWVTIGTTSDRGEFVHADPDQGVSHQYRVRAVSSNPTLYSTWSASSNVVQLIAPPLAPSLVEPQGVVDRDEPFVFRWRHNPVDTTDQTEFELEWWLSYQPNNPVTVTGGSEQEVSQSPLGSTNSFSWRVRTKGEYAGANPWSPWSPTQTFNAVSRPEVVIQTPESTLEESQVEVVWGYQNADPSAQSRWEAQLLDAEDNVLATGSGSNTATSHLFPTILEDATTYTVRVRARAGSGLWSEWDTSTFTTDFPLPAEVEALPEWDRATGSVSITFDAQPWAQYSWEGTPGASSSIRVDADGEVTNLIGNGGFEYGIQGWSGSGQLLEIVATSSFHDRMWSTDQGGPGRGGGQRLLMLTCKPDETNFYAVQTSNAYFDVEPGRFIAAACLLANTAGTESELRVQFRNANGQEIPGTALVDVAASGYFAGRRAQVVGMVPEGATHARIVLWGRVRGGASSEGKRIYADDVIAAQADTSETALAATGIYFDGDTQSTTTAETIDVQRDDGDGWITIAVDLDPETSIVDHTPRLGEVRYRTISRTELPTARLGPETVIEWEHGTADPVYVNGGPEFETVATAIGHEVTDSPDIEQALQEWAGWEKATAVFGTGESYAIQFRGKIFPNLPHLDGRSTLQEWHALQLRRGIVCYRDCQGRKIFGLLGIGFSTSSGVTDINLSVSEARHVEGVRTVLPIPEDVD